ncbi:hypothetical protein [Marinobacter maritimus]|uniref:hypothetical protein n=1 Tax=Marinobacter maritimus TaxID=277961 RepID=UPI0011A2F5B0|nr:hypothetical protein [Marinobacter maritimus]
MERTSPSMSYVDLQNTLDEGFAEQRHRDLWLFLYSSRHAHPELWQPGSAKDRGMQERDYLIDEAALLLEKHSPPGPWELFFKKRELAAKLHEFCFCITYAFHKRVLADGFIDIRAESQRGLHNDFINTLTRDEIDVVSRLHDLTYKYGFVITELWTSLTSSADILEAFVIKNLGYQYLAHHPYFVFPKRGNHPQGIQISIKEYHTAIIEPWDLLLFFNENESLSKIKYEISNSWQLPGNQVIGDHNNHKIAFYVDRKQCSIGNLLDTIKLQIDHLNDYKDGLSLIAEPEDLGGFKKNRAKAKKEAKRNLSSTIDRLRLSEGLIHKRWSVEQSNVRRSVGLYLWDQKNIATPSRSRKSITRDLIDKLKRQKPEALEFYLKNFNKYDSPAKTTKFGDSLGALETVTREMEADFELTDICIRNFEFLAPQDVKSRRRKS